MGILSNHKHYYSNSWIHSFVDGIYNHWVKRPFPHQGSIPVCDRVNVHPSRSKRTEDNIFSSTGNSTLWRPTFKLGLFFINTRHNQLDNTRVHIKWQTRLKKWWVSVGPSQVFRALIIHMEKVYCRIRCFLLLRDLYWCCVPISILPWAHLTIVHYPYSLSALMFRCQCRSKSNTLWCTNRKWRMRLPPRLLPRNKHPALNVELLS